MPIARVFPRRTNATPPKSDEYAFVGDIPLFLPPDITEVHVSVAFSWDLQEAARLADAWSRVAPVKLGGPATGERGHDFIPGMYLKKGCVITSRGCPNHCWFCSVPEREGPLRELPVTEGNNVLDDNLLACSEQHIYKVFDMLDKQTNVILSGGLEAARLRPWHVALFERVHVKEAFLPTTAPTSGSRSSMRRKSLRQATGIDLIRCAAISSADIRAIRSPQQKSAASTRCASASIPSRCSIAMYRADRQKTKTGLNFRSHGHARRR